VFNVSSRSKLHRVLRILLCCGASRGANEKLDVWVLCGNNGRALGSLAMSGNDIIRLNLRSVQQSVAGNNVNGESRL
jgi:hypothetical protein